MKQIFQHDSMECGAACLAMICSHFNKPMPLKETVKACNATREGVSMLGLKQVATEIGFEVIIAQGKIEDLDNEESVIYIHTMFVIHLSSYSEVLHQEVTCNPFQFPIHLG